MKPVFIEMSKQFLAVVFFLVDVDDWPIIADEFEVRTILPTFVFMKKGQVFDHVYSAAKAELQRKLVVP